MESTKEKIDKALGLTAGQSIDDFLGKIDSDLSAIEAPFNDISDDVKAELQHIDDKLTTLTASGRVSELTICSIEDSMCEVEELIRMAKSMFKHVYENVISSELCDSELIGSVSKLLESIHINIAEFISMYKDRQKFIEKVKFTILQQNMKKELMDKKQQQAIELMKLKSESGAIDADDKSASGGVSQEQMVRLLQDIGFCDGKDSTTTSNALMQSVFTGDN